jgi:hypothetical protein
MSLSRLPVNSTLIALLYEISEGLRSGSKVHDSKQFDDTQYTFLLTPSPLFSISGGVSSSPASSVPSTM